MPTEATNNVTIVISESQLTRLLDVQDFDKTKWDETCEHIFELGLSARENSIKATKKRNAQQKLADNIEAFNKYLAMTPELRNDPAKLLEVMQRFDLGLNALASEISSKKEKAA